MTTKDSKIKTKLFNASSLPNQCEESKRNVIILTDTGLRNYRKTFFFFFFKYSFLRERKGGGGGGAAEKNRKLEIYNQRPGIFIQMRISF